MSGRRRLFGGISTSPAATRDIYAPRDSILLPASGAPLERPEPLQTIFDCLAVGAGFLLISALGVGIAFAAFVLLFVRTV